MDLSIGIHVIGMFFKVTQSDVPLVICDVCKAVLPSNSILRVRMFELFDVKLGLTLQGDQSVWYEVGNSLFDY